MIDLRHGDRWLVLLAHCDRRLVLLAHLNGCFMCCSQWLQVLLAHCYMCCSHTWPALHARCRDMKGLMSLKQRDIKPLYRYARFNVSTGVSLHIEIWKVFIKHLLTQDNDLILLISLSWSHCLDLIVLCPWALFIKLLTHDHDLLVLCPWAHDQLCRPASLWGATGPRTSISSANCMSHVQMVWGVRLKGK